MTCYISQAHSSAMCSAFVVDSFELCVEIGQFILGNERAGLATC